MAPTEPCPVRSGSRSYQKKVGSNNYRCVGSSRSTISKTCRASCGTSAWAPAKNCLRWCRSGREANLITTLNGRSLLGLNITDNSSAWVQHIRTCLSTKTQCWDSFMELTDKNRVCRFAVVCYLWNSTCCWQRTWWCSDSSMTFAENQQPRRIWRNGKKCWSNLPVLLPSSSSGSPIWNSLLSNGNFPAVYKLLRPS